ncbi:hypothetical protein CGRA01v4_02964 [Colletotrichum graminicola]|nr:hypothetical protein CGRA01v4_02964 [Colletotrichum graminicola]
MLLYPVSSCSEHVGPNKLSLSHTWCPLAPGRTNLTSRYHCGLLRTAYCLGCSQSAHHRRHPRALTKPPSTSIQMIELITFPYFFLSPFRVFSPSASPSHIYIYIYTHKTTYIRNLTNAFSTLDSPCPVHRHWSSALPAHHAGDGPQRELPLHHDHSLGVVSRRFVAPHGLLSRGMEQTRAGNLPQQARTARSLQG